MPGSSPFDRSRPRRGSEPGPEPATAGEPAPEDQHPDQVATVLERERPASARVARPRPPESQATESQATESQATESQPPESEATDTAEDPAGASPGPAGIELLTRAYVPVSATEERVGGTAVEALRRDEIRRNRLLATFGLSMLVSVAVALFFLPGDPVMTRITWIALSVAALSNVWLLLMTLRPERFNPAAMAVIWLIASAAVAIGIIYFGVFSPGPMVVTVAVYFLALGQSLALALGVYATFAGIQLLATILFVTGVAHDPGLVHADHLAPAIQLLLEGLVQLVLFSVLLMARASRRVTLAAVREHESAVRAVAQRDALLLEARQDLERALHLGGLGRYSGQTMGSYRLGPILGRGSMGEVYQASHARTGEPAAVKMLASASLSNPGFVLRFLREVRLAARLDMPHAVKVLEVGDDSAPMPYLAMERLRGHDLAELLREVRRLEGTKVVEMVEQVGRGLAAASQAGIVHRDIKPQNLFLAEQAAGPAIWKILDFGVSRLVGDTGTLTEGHVVGTPVYMAPEQARGLEVTGRTDLYALAAIAYRCLTGHLPYRARDVPTTLYQVVHSMPARPSLLANLPRDIDAVLLLGMAKDPSHRLDGQALAEGLDQALRGQLAEPLRRRARELGEVHPWHE